NGYSIGKGEKKRETKCWVAGNAAEGVPCGSWSGTAVPAHGNAVSTRVVFHPRHVLADQEQAAAGGSFQVFVCQWIGHGGRIETGPVVLDREQDEFPRHIRAQPRFLLRVASVAVLDGVDHRLFQGQAHGELILYRIAEVIHGGGDSVEKRGHIFGGTRGQLPPLLRAKVQLCRLMPARVQPIGEHLRPPSLRWVEGLGWVRAICYVWMGHPKHSCILRAGLPG